MNGLQLPARGPAMVLALAVASVAQGVAAAEFDYGLRAGVGYSDNVNLTPTDEVSSGAAVVGIELRGERPTGRFRYDVLGDLSYYDYFESGLDGQQFGSLLAISEYDFVPERVSWFLGGSFDQGRVDILRPSSPSNLEDVYTITTGPTFRSTLGGSLEALLEGRYTMARYSERDLDSETIGGRFVLGRRLSERSLIGIGVSADDVSYDTASGAVVPDFERKEAFLHVAVEGARTTLDLDAGYSEVSGDGIDDDGTVIRLEATRRLTPYISGFVNYTQEFPTSEGASFTPTRPGAMDDPTVLTGGPRETRDAQIGLDLDRQRTLARLTYTRRKETTLGAIPAATVERELDEVMLSVTRRIAARASAGVFGAYSEQVVSAFNSEYDETAFGASLAVALGRMLTLDVRVEQRERDGDVPADRFSELSGGIYLRYGTSGR